MLIKHIQLRDATGHIHQTRCRGCEGARFRQRCPVPLISLWIKKAHEQGNPIPDEEST